MGEKYVVSRVAREVVQVQKRKRPVGLQQGADCKMVLEVIYKLIVPPRYYLEAYQLRVS